MPKPYSRNEAEAGIAYAGNNTIYLDVSDNQSRGVIHHEFFHIIDYKDNGLFVLDPYADKKWESLNKPDPLFVDVKASNWSEMSREMHSPGFFE